MYRFFRPLFFQLDPELAHQFTLQLVRLAGIVPLSRWMLRTLFTPPEKPVEAFGLRFRNPVGLAAGYDKDCQAVAGLSALGFGHLELGTITLRPQPGNPKPRIFRLIEDGAVINRMGFPGRGAGYASHQLSVISDQSPVVSRRQPTVIGVNLGKNKDTPLEEAAQEYVTLTRTFAPLADYLAINISSPNTAGLRRLQGRDMLENLLSEIARERAECGVRRPVLVKLAPDLTDEELDDALGVILATGMDGVIATNTTLAREGLRSGRQAESGGLSGGPLTVRADALLVKIVARLGRRIPVIGVGGIMSPDDAKRRLDLGAALVQVYTGMIYAGPGFVKQIVKAI